jgi:hypothetical protein
MIYPGDLSGGGLRVYSGDRRHASRIVVEPKGPDNQWQETRFLYDAKRAGEVRVAETPSAANGYRLTLGCTGRPVSAIVIEWRAVR